MTDITHVRHVPITVTDIENIIIIMRWALIDDSAQPANLRSQVMVFSACQGALCVVMWWF